MRRVIPILAVAVIALITACHPYYNTFYNAEEAFARAQRRHVPVMRNYPDSIVVTPSAEMTALYDRSIEKSLKMMEVYPRDVKRQDRAHYLMGRASFYKKDFDVSISRMRDLQDGFSESRLVPRSHLYVAKSHIMLDNLNIAEELLLRLLEEYPELDKKQEVTMLLVDIAMRRGGRSHALGLLEGVSLSGLPVATRAEILLRMADLQFELRQYPQALGLLRSAPRIKTLSGLMFRIDRLIYLCHDAMDSHDNALRHLNVMERNRNYRERRDEIYYYRALTLFRMGRVDEALAILEGIRMRCDDGTGRADTSSLCARAAYELANIYMSRGDLQTAMELLEEAMKSKDVASSNNIPARLIALRKLHALRQPDSTGKIPVSARYSIAELFQFELGAPDSAYAYYMGLISDADTSMRPQAMLMAAMVSKAELADTTRADSLFWLVIMDYEGSEYARRAQIELDVEVTVVTPEEIAEREFLIAEAMVERDLVEAVKAFYNIYKENPELEIAPRSLYAAAWHTDNGLQRKRAAMILYEELCEQYPDSKLCKEQAEPRIKIARDSMDVRRMRRGRSADTLEGASADTLTDADAPVADTTAAQEDAAVPSVPASETDGKAVKKEDGDSIGGDGVDDVDGYDLDEDEI